MVVIHRLHQILEPFMLRRQVQDVEGALPEKARPPLAPHRRPPPWPHALVPQRPDECLDIVSITTSRSVCYHSAWTCLSNAHG